MVPVFHVHTSEFILIKNYCALIMKKRRFTECHIKFTKDKVAWSIVESIHIFPTNNQSDQFPRYFSPSAAKYVTVINLRFL